MSAELTLNVDDADLVYAGLVQACELMSADLIKHRNADKTLMRSEDEAERKELRLKALEDFRLQFLASHADYLTIKNRRTFGQPRLPLDKGTYMQAGDRVTFKHDDENTIHTITGTVDFHGVTMFTIDGYAGQFAAVVFDLVLNEEEE